MPNREVNVTKRVRMKSVIRKARITLNGVKMESVGVCQWAKIQQTPIPKRLRKEAELNAVNHGVSVIPTDGPTDSVVVLWINVVVVFSF